jgi:hypothetical protein
VLELHSDCFRFCKWFLVGKWFSLPALISSPPVFVPLPATFPTLYDTLNFISGNSNFYGPFVSGGALYLALINSSASGFASLNFFEIESETDYFTLTAVASGAGGNSISFAVTGVGTPNLSLAVSVVGNAISVQVATDGAGNSTTTRDQMVTALNATPAVTALVTITPIGISFLVIANYGPTFLFGGTGGASIKMYSSSDQGLTWSILDGAHEPTGTAINAYSIAQAGTVLHIALVTSTNDVLVKTFDCSTNLWGAASATAGVSGAIGLAVTVQASGTRFVFYTHSGNANVINLVQLTAGGVWSGPTTIATAGAGTFNRLTGASIDGSAVSHVFWEHRSTGGVTNCKLQTIGVDSTGALVGVVTDISASTATITTLQTDTAAIPEANLTLGANGTYAQPVPWQAGLGGVVTNILPEVVLGNPTDGWSTSSPDPLGLSIPAGSVAACFQCVSSGAFIYAFWTVYDQAEIGAVGQVWYAAWNGSTWGAPQLVYDFVSNPPPAPADSPAFLTAESANAIILGSRVGLAMPFQVSSNPPATHGTAFPVFFGISPAPPVVEPNPPAPESGGGPPKLLRARPGPVVDLHPVKSKCAECTCDTILDLVLMQSDVLLLD